MTALALVGQNEMRHAAFWLSGPTRPIVYWDEQCERRMYAWEISSIQGNISVRNLSGLNIAINHLKHRVSE